MIDTCKILILCVDDEKNVLRSLERIFLDQDGYEVVTAISGVEALEIMERQGPFRIVISDYRMPVMNGLDFLRVVQGRWPDTVRIVLSGYADSAEIKSALNDGLVYKLLAKPWNGEELLATIAGAVEIRDLRNKDSLPGPITQHTFLEDGAPMRPGEES